MMTLLASPAASGRPLQQTHPTLRTASPQWQMGGGSAQTGMDESLTNLSLCSTGTASTVYAGCSPVACARVGLKPSCALLAAHTPTPSCTHAACFLPAHPTGCCRKEGPPPHIAVWNESDTLKHGNEVGCVRQPRSHPRPSHWGGGHLPSARSAPLAPRHCPAAPVPRGPMACMRRLRRPAPYTRQLGAWAAKQGSWPKLCTQLRRPSPPAGLSASRSSLLFKACPTLCHCIATAGPCLSLGLASAPRLRRAPPNCGRDSKPVPKQAAVVCRRLTHAQLPQLAVTHPGR